MMRHMMVDKPVKKYRVPNRWRQSGDPPKYRYVMGGGWRYCAACGCSDGAIKHFHWMACPATMPARRGTRNAAG